MSRKTYLDLWLKRIDGYERTIVDIFAMARLDHWTQERIIDEINSQVKARRTYAAAPRWVQELVEGFWTGMITALETYGLVIYKYRYRDQWVDYEDVLSAEIGQLGLGLFIWADTFDIFFDPNKMEDLCNVLQEDLKEKNHG